jgi:hypothetical protein
MSISELVDEDTRTRTLRVSDLETQEPEHILDDPASYFSLFVGAGGLSTWYN